MQQDHFNFRHLMERLGIPMTKKNNWAIGHALQAFAASKGITPDRRLTEKTNPNPSVSAPHCIAHYPMEIMDDAVKHFANFGEDDGQQLTFDL